MKKFLAGILIGALLTGSVTVMAKGGKMIEVFYTIKKIVIDENNKPLDSKKKSFIYNGEAYVPLSFLSDYLGIEAKWNSKTGTVAIGESADQETHFWEQDIKAAYNKGSVKYYNNGKKIKDTMGDTYTNYLITLPYKKSTIDFPLRGKYKEFKAILGTPAVYNDYNGAGFTVEIDGEEVFSQEVMPEDLPEEISFDLTGANKITFTTAPNEDNGGIALFNGEFIK